MNNTTVSGNPLDQSDLHESLAIQVTRLTIYPLVLIFGLVGNCAVCWILIFKRKFKRKRSASGCYLLLNLCISDFLVLLIFLPFDLAYVQNDWVWPFGSFLCGVINSLEHTCLAVSSTTLLAISRDRYMGIVHPLHQSLTKRQTLCLIACMWIYAILTNLPFTLALYIDEASGECKIDLNWWPNTITMQLSYVCLFFAPEFMIPMSCIATMYYRIAAYLRKHQRSLAIQGNQRIASLRAKQNSKTLKVLTALVLCYTILILPYNIITLAAVFNNEYLYSMSVREAYEFSRLVTSINSCINPLLYGAIRQDVQKNIRIFFSKKHKLSFRGTTSRCEDVVCIKYSRRYSI